MSQPEQPEEVALDRQRACLPDDLVWFAQQLPCCVAVFDARGRCLLANSALLLWLGCAEADVLGRSPFDLWPSEVALREAADLDLVLQGAHIEHQEKRPSVRGERSVRVVKFPWLWAGRVEGMVVLFDESSAPPVESLAQPDALGRIPRAIGHDFNQLRNLLSGQVRLLEGLLDTQPAAAAALDNLKKSFDYVCQLPRQLLGFVHNEPQSRQRLDVNALLLSLGGLLQPPRPAADLTQRRANEPIALDYQLQPGGAWVEGDPLQLTRALLNLAENALAARTNHQEGLLHVETRTVTVADDQGQSHGTVIRVTIHDNGSGIAAEVLPSLYEPLFPPRRLDEQTTTSRPGGSGLGLAIVSEVVHQHGGWITRQSNAGQGTRFLLHLPAASATAIAPAESTRSAVLVVERDPDIRHLTALILEQGPFRACSAATLEQASQVALAAEEPIDLVVVAGDLFGGQAKTSVERASSELLDLLQQLPGAGLLVTTSGEPPALAPACHRAVRGYLPKPYSADLLLRAAQAALGRKAPSEPPERF